MKRFVVSLVGACVWVGVLGVVAFGEVTPAVRALVEVERAFAQASVAKGTRDAYLEFLADDSLLFRPGPVPGKMFTRNRPAPPGKLVWAPSFADVSASGDVGYTTGPYEFRKGEMTEAPTGYGHYLSVWRKQKDGAWKLEVNLTVTHDKPAVAVADVKNVETSPAAAAAAASGPGAKAADAKAGDEKGAGATAADAKTAADKAAAQKAGDAKPAAAKPADAKAADAKTADAKAADVKPAQTDPAAPGAAAAAAGTPIPNPAKLAEESLKELDRAFAKQAGEQTAVKAYLAHAADGIRIFRTGELPTSGKAALEKMSAASLGSSWQPAHARMAASGDLAYTTGMITFGAAGAPAAPGQGQPRYYVRVWRKDKAGTWKLESDMVM